LLAISAQLKTRLSTTRLIGLVPAVTGLRACDRDPNAGKTVRERGEPQTATSSFNTHTATHHFKSEHRNYPNFNANTTHA
jgi:hypothetical protein